MASDYVNAVENLRSDQRKHRGGARLAVMTAALLLGVSACTSGDAARLGAASGDAAAAETQAESETKPYPGFGPPKHGHHGGYYEHDGYLVPTY